MRIVEKPVERERVTERIIERPASPPQEPLQGYRKTGPVAPPAQAEVKIVYVPTSPPAQSEVRTSAPAARPEVQEEVKTPAQPAQSEEKTPAPSSKNIRTEEIKTTRKGEENNSDQRTKTIHPEEEKNSENNSRKNSSRIVPELFTPDKSASQAPANSYKKKGKVGRKRKYEEPGTNGEIPVKEVVLFRHEMGRHWPGMSEDMQKWYNFYYFTRPSKGKDKSKYEQHVRAYERGRKWISESAEEE